MRRPKKLTVELINSIPCLLAERKMTLREAQDLVWEHIYCTPVLYGIADLNEDQRSDFLIFISKKIKRFITEFAKERKATFTSYLMMLLKYEKKSWIRRISKKLTEARSSMENFEMNYESQFEDYKMLEPEQCVAELNEIDIESLNALHLNTKQKEITRETVLMLLLKSCHSTDDKMIRAVSKFCKIDENKLFSLIEDLRMRSFYKIDSKKEVVKRMQNHYYFHKKYTLELEKLNEESIDFQKTKEKLQRRSASWRRYVFSLSNLRTPTPSNSVVAEVLNMNERTVQRYIERAKKKRLEILEDLKDDDDKKI